MTTIHIVGAGSHGKALGEIARFCGHAIVFYDDDPTIGVPIEKVTEHDAWVIGVHNPHTRYELAQRIEGRPTRLVHPSAIRGEKCVRREGSVLAAGVILTREVEVGAHTHLNVGVTVSQGSRLGDYCTVSPGAHIAGETTIGDRTFIGVGATVANLLTIGNDVTIGAGAVVVEDIPDGVTVVGNPARVLERA